jgi:hypothetical protein
MAFPLHRLSRPLRGAAAAALLVPVLHQPLVALANRWGLAPWVAFDLTPVPPFGVPALVSAIAFGALWGIPLLAVTGRGDRRSPIRDLVAGGAIGMSSVVVGALLSVARGDAIEHPLRPLFVAAIINVVWASAASFLARRGLEQPAADR